MNQISTDLFSGGSEPLTMSSREIAELTGKRHDHVMRDIRGMLEGLGEAAPSFGGSYQGEDGTTRPCFHLPKRECLILVSGYSVELRAKIIDRWMELETGAASAAALDLRNPATLNRVALQLIEINGELEGRVRELEPKAQALDRLGTAEGSLCITDAAKTLKVRPKDLFAFLRARGWVYRRAGGDADLGYQSKIVSGLLEHKTTTVTRPDGTEKVTTQVRVTAKGLAALARVIPPAVDEV